MENLTPETNQTPSNPNEEENKRSLFAYSELNETTPAWKKVTLFLVGFLGFQLIATLISVIICLTPLYDKDTKTLSLLGSTLVNFLSYLAGVAVLIGICFIGKDNTAKKIFVPFKDKKTYQWGAIGFLMLLAVGILFNILYSFIPGYKENSNQSSLNTMTGSYPVLVLLMASIMAPIVEEITYRAGLLDLFGKKNRWLGIIVSSILFGLIHFDFTTILSLIRPQTGYTDSLGQYIQYTAEQLAKIKADNLQAFIVELENLPTYILSGMVLGFVYCRTGSLSTSIFTHFLNNAYSLLALIISNAMSNGSTSDSASNLLRIFFR